MPLVLDLLRHGEAAASSPDGDAGRPLTPRGADAIERLARQLAANGGGWDHAFSSPLVRARQTARILLAAFPGAPAPRVLRELEPDADPTRLVGTLRALGAGTGRVLLVGHMPLLGGLAGELGDGGSLPLLTGQLVRFEFPDAIETAAGRRVLSLRGDTPG